MTWQKSVGGRIKNDPRFGSTVTWNTFPLPPAYDRLALINAGKRILEARKITPYLSLAEMYEPARMARDLLSAHIALDDVMDRVMGAAKRCESELERQHLLFENYEKLIGSMVT